MNAAGSNVTYGEATADNLHNAGFSGGCEVVLRLYFESGTPEDGSQVRNTMICNSTLGGVPLLFGVFCGGRAGVGC